jgi:hypothetical protein
MITLARICLAFEMLHVVASFVGFVSLAMYVWTWFDDEFLYIVVRNLSRWCCRRRAQIVMESDRFGLGPPIVWTQHNNGGTWYLQRVGSNDVLANPTWRQQRGLEPLAVVRAVAADLCEPLKRSSLSFFTIWSDDRRRKTRVIEVLAPSTRASGPTRPEELRRAACDTDSTNGILHVCGALWSLEQPNLWEHGTGLGCELVVLFLSRHFLVLGNFRRTILRIYSRSEDAMPRDSLRDIVRELRASSGYGPPAMFETLRFIDPCFAQDVDRQAVGEVDTLGPGGMPIVAAAQGAGPGDCKDQKD